MLVYPNYHLIILNLFITIHIDEHYNQFIPFQTTVDKFLFGGYTSGTLRLLKDELNGRWKKALGSLIKIPYAIQPLQNGELAFGAMKSKNGTIRHE